MHGRTVPFQVKLPEEVNRTTFCENKQYLDCARFEVLSSSLIEN